MYANFLDVKAKDEFGKLGIQNWENWEFQKFNLIMGENGAGKSRFLKAVKEYCKKTNQLYIYMDFSNSLIYKSANDNQQDLDDNTSIGLTDSLVYKNPLEQENFSDFVPFIEKDSRLLFNYFEEIRHNDATRRGMQRNLNRLNKYLNEFLQRTIVIDKLNCGISTRENANIVENFNDAISRMSPGEKAILYFTLGIFCVELVNEDYILLIDEPESHLHPCALIKLIDVIKAGDKPKYAFIASHSVFLIPRFSFQEIIFIESGKISPPSGRKYLNIYNSLVGFEDKNGDSQSLYSFLMSINDWQYTEFLTECFKEPGSVDRPNENDQQYKKLQELIKRYLKQDTIKILDFGAGSGRIAKCFNLTYKKQPEDKLWNILKYSVYDKYIISKDLPETPWMQPHYKDEISLEKDKGTFDIIVLFNVLHEVSIDEWIETLNLTSSMLNEKGCIIFGERNVLSKGERPFGKSGYLVLGLKELEVLFDTKKIEEIILSDVLIDPTSCYVIKKTDIGEISYQGVNEVLSILSSNTFTKIKECLKEDFSIGRKYAFYCQQYINSLYAMTLRESDDVSNFSLADILHKEQDQKKRKDLIYQRSLLSDAEAEACRKWLANYSPDK